MRQVLGDIVVLKHASGVRGDALAARLAAASGVGLREFFAPPVSPAPMTAPDGRLVTVTTLVTPLAAGEPPPWREAGRLLGRLHRAPVPADLPEHDGRAVLAAAVAVADAFPPGGATDILRELGRTLLATWPTTPRPAVVHGDWSLDALGRLPGTDIWVLAGVETMGLGSPAWDLGRPAGLWAAGLLDEESWRGFLAGYAEGGGALPTVGESWGALEHPARCGTYLAAVQAVEGDPAHPGATAEALLRACVTMNGRRW